MSPPVEIQYNPAAVDDARYVAGCGPVYASGESPNHALAKLAEKLAARRERDQAQAR